jgi:hypothetical protein
VTVQDLTSAELAEAWARAYGRNPDPSDAWDHAIKAVETVLISVVVPEVNKATLGRVIERLVDKKKPPFRLLLTGNDGSHSVEPLVGMLRLMWPNLTAMADHRNTPVCRRSKRRRPSYTWR